ncbi:DNA helicase/exodeoxyribonuclease V, alpha subunit [Ectothiorhodosinus mongolicus]|uniref:RecBCD enzyme subunit RecD n=1 Tax=Ectothiorhodosinus mongolicus TaxID=233100 RepID=A0A1R3VMD7_9GAMM|nr:exodeoxyribonuclease V subunit alpha [Ectothiorhodosinus mongolicus]ULX56247.1 exodeoxyribonuclease V subunit alpha [Ectothiorhodosinus mongolicus]SIT65751.1 DNA helicase/exodeoxyribonuclease V, alpha subunit [Ectothiorhodosinus mongolicus]
MNTSQNTLIAPAQALQNSDRMLKLLIQWREAGWLRAIDVALARLLADTLEDAPSLALLAAALCSHQVGRGHVCLDLAALMDDPSAVLGMPNDNHHDDEGVCRPEALVQALTLGQWQQALQYPPLLSLGAPLICRVQRVYLRRYDHAEALLAEHLLKRLAPLEGVDAALLTDTAARLFSAQDEDLGKADQMRACVTAAQSRFCLITGGPGTGKTSTVLKLLALLLSVHAQQHPEDSLPRIRLCAPSGKAAARLTDSLAQRLDELDLGQIQDPERIKAAIPLQVDTLHRLLGRRLGKRQPHYNAERQLPVEILIVDEASMVDLEMMADLLQALPAQARLVLLGDKDQLASVEAGAVLAELYESQRPTLCERVVTLRHSYRFTADSGISLLANAVNQGDAPAVEEIFQQDREDLDRQRLDTLHDQYFSQQLCSIVPSGGYGAYLLQLKKQRPAPNSADSEYQRWAKEVLQTHQQFQILAAVRQGTRGVEGLNRHIAELLYVASFIDAKEGWYEGRPILVTRNDHVLGVMNGDIGVVLMVPEKDTDELRLRVAFLRPELEGGVLWVSPARLQSVESVYALTVHKAQGSEFAHTMLVLPEHPSPVLTRELVYTGITRASQRLSLVEPGSSEVLQSALKRRVARASGLAHRLDQQP